MNLASVFASNAAKQPEKTAIFWGDTTYSYSELYLQALWTADRLKSELGLQPGDRVAMWLRNRPEFVSTLFAILLADGIAVPVNSFLKPDEAGFILNDAACDRLVTDSELGQYASELKQARPSLKTFQVESIPAKPAASTPGLEPRRESDDLAVIIYTSGTTGHPKGAMLSHGNLWHNVESCREMLEAIEQDRFAVLLPMFHSFMLTVGVFLPLLVGSSLVLVKSLHPVKNVVQEIVEHQATLLPAIPQFFRMLAHSTLSTELPVRLCLSGAAPLPVEVLRQFNRRFSIPLLEGYGLSEASPVVSLNPIRGPWKAGSIGVPVPGVSVSIQNEQGQTLPPHEIGELCVHGGNVMQGYWQRPEETAKVLRKGWLFTGDVGYQDEDGYFFITDRKKDMLLVNGINVYPREIEEVIYHFPGVTEAAVIGEPDSRKGEHPVAFVAIDPSRQSQSSTAEASAIEKDLLQFLQQRLANYKVPRTVHLVEALPRNATGKILKTELRRKL